MLKYKAFISYSHSTDKNLAPKIQKELRLLGRPLFRKEAFNIFRDETNLSVNPDLWSYIEDALSQSEFFIYLASPSAANSKWVKKEISYWLQNKSIDNLIILISEGELKWNDDENDFDWKKSDCLPELMIGVYSSEPLYIDLREVKNLDHVEFKRDLLIKVIEPVSAKLHDKSVDELFGDITRIHRQRVTLRNIAIITLFVLTVLSMVLGFTFYENSKVGELIIQANRLAEENPTKAMRYYRKALSTKNDQRILISAEQFDANNIFYTDSIGPFEEQVSDVFFSENYNLMAVVYIDSVVQFWDMVKKNSISKLIKLNSRCKNILFSPNNREFLVSHSVDEVYFLKDTSIIRKQAIDSTYIPKFSKASQNKLDEISLKFSDYDDEVEINDSLNNIHATLIGHNSYISEVELSPGNNLLLTSSVDRTIKIWSPDGTNLYTLKGHQEDVGIARFIDNGDKIFSIEIYNQYAKIWTLKGFFLKTIPLLPDEQKSIDYNDGLVDIMVSGFFEGDSVVYSAKYNVDNTSSSTDYYIDVQKLSGEHIARINDIYVEPYAERSVSYVQNKKGILAVKENSANIWDLWGTELKAYPHHEVTFATASPDGSLVLTLGYDSIKVYNLESTELLTSISLSQTKYDPLDIVAHTAIFSSDGKFFYLGVNGKITQWVTDRLMVIDSIPIGDDVLQIVSMDISSESNELLVATSSEGVFRINLKDKSIKRFANHTIMNNAVKYNPTGQQYLTSGANGQLKLWSKSDQILKEFYTGPPLWSVDFSHDGKYIICGSRKGTQIWRGIDPLQYDDYN
ncbi:MAG: TIR domain-containing protein [Bacteroidota bacterium]